MIVCAHRTCGHHKKAQAEDHIQQEFLLAGQGEFACHEHRHSHRVQITDNDTHTGNDVDGKGVGAPVRLARSWAICFPITFCGRASEDEGEEESQGIRHDECYASMECVYPGLGV